MIQIQKGILILFVGFMSILSNSNYEQTVQAITRLKQLVQDQSSQEMKKYEIIATKTKIIQQRILHAQLALDKHQADCSRKVDQFAAETKQRLKELKQTSNDKEVESDLIKHLKDLDSCKDKLSKLIKNQHQASAEKLQIQINQIQKNFNQKVKCEKQSFAQAEKAIRDQVNKVRQRLIKNDYERRSQEIVHTLEEMKGGIDKQLGQLRAKRKQKKEKFLELLEAIVIKCKETHEARP